LENYHIQYIIKPTKDIAFSESAAFRDVLLIAKKRKPKKEDATKVVFLKKPIKEIKENLIEIILKTENGYTETRQIKYSELINHKDNFMPLLMPKELYFLLETLAESNKLTSFDINQIDIGLPYRPQGVADGVFITRPLDESRIKNIKIIILEENQNYVTVGIKGISKNQFSYKFKKEYLRDAVRTNTGIRKLAISKKETDYILIKKDEKYWKQLRNYGIKIPNPFPWNFHSKNNLIKGNSFLVIPRKIRLNSPNTFIISIYSEEKLNGVGPSLWYLKSDKKNAKILNIYFNSILTILQISLFKSETLGAGYFELMKNDWSQFKVLDISKLSHKEELILLHLFEKLKEVEFPSILEQLQRRFWARVELDKTILKILGFSEEEIKEWLPKVYDALVEELKAMKNIK